MGEIRQFFSVLFSASPRLTALWWLLVVVRGLLPAVFAVAIGVVVGAVQDGDPLGPGLAVIGASFVAIQALGPVHDAISANLGASLSGWLHEKLLVASVSPSGVAHLESPALADELSTARDFDLGITGPSLTASVPYIGGGFAAFAGGGSQALLLAGYRWWAPILIGGAWLSTHHFLKSSAIWRDRHSPESMEQQRQADYAYRLAVQSPAAKEMRLFGLGDWVVSGFRSLRHVLNDKSWDERALKWQPTRYAIALITAANLVFFWSLARDASAGHVELASLVVFAQAAVGASALAFGEFDWWLRTSAQPVPLVLGIAEKMADAGGLTSGDERADGLPAHAIHFDHVSFAYPTTTKLVFDGFDLTIPAGKSMAIVGQNGAGKTTMAKLLCRLYDPTEGAVLVDGTDLRELDLASWRRRIAAVFQDFVRYELPMRDNVAPGGASDVDVLVALTDARAENLADPSTVLSRAYADGTDLSGGQWQRVALARALCAVRLGAGVVILDEPTAQLDVRGEAEIFEKLLVATRGCTTILISHRFSTVRKADLICVVEAGRVVELGSHDELMARKGRYRTMFDLQAARFDDPDEADLEVLD